MSTFTLQNDFGWLSIDTSTGAITANTTEYINGKFPVVVVEDDNGTITNHDISIAVYAEVSSLSAQTNNEPLTETNEGVMIQSANSYFGLKIPKSPTSSEWKWVLFYREKYGSLPMDIIKIDNETDVITKEVNSTFAYSYNGGTDTIRTDEWKQYVLAFEVSGSSRRISSYDPVNDTIVFDAVTPMTGFTGEKANMALDPTTRKLVIFANGDTGYGSIGTIDTSDNSITVLTTTLGNTARTSPKADGLAVGQDFIYAVMGQDPNRELYSISKDGATIALVASTTDNLGSIDLTRLRWGVLAKFTAVVGYTDGDYYVYNGSIIPVADGIPWTAIDTTPENLGPELVGALAPYSDAYASNVPSSGIAPIQITTNSVVTQYTPTVAVYPYPLNNAIASSDNSVFSSARDYGGFADYDTLNNTYNTQVASTMSRVELLKLNNGKILAGGYPSQSTYLKDTPNSALNFLGYGGGEIGPSSGHYYQGLVEFTDGLVYGTGVQFRLGDSGTMTWFNPEDFDNTVGGINDTDEAIFSSYALNNCAVVGDKIILSTYIIPSSGATEALILVFDPVSKSVVNSFSLGTDIVTTGWIIGISDTEIFGYTALPDAHTTTVMYRMNIVTGAIAYKNSFVELRSTFKQDTFQAYSVSIKKDTEGRVLFPVFSDALNYYLARVDPVLCGVELTGTISGEEQISLFDNSEDVTIAKSTGDLSIVAKTALDLAMVAKVLVLDVEELQYPDLKGVEFGAGTAWTNDATAGTWTFNRSGGDIFFYKSNLTLEVGASYEVVMDIESITATSNNYLNVDLLGELFYPPVGISKRTIVMPNPISGSEFSVGMFADVTNAVINSISIKKLVNSLA